MKLLRVGPAGSERPALLDAEGILRDLSGHIDDITWAELSPSRLAALGQLYPRALPVIPAGQRLGPPVAGFARIICVGLNYIDHAREVGLSPPSEPTLFLKGCAATGPDDPEDSSTANLIFSVEEVVAYVSQFFELRPGDLIATGTPAGVGLGHTPAVFLKPGDVIELGIDGLGSQRQEVRAWEA